jgi:nitrate reductase (NAD(P)H)
MLPGKLGNVGWREEEAKASEASRAALVSTAAPVAVATTASGLDPTKQYVTMEMLEEHQEEDSVWFAYKNQVYDGTPFLNDHPGGADSILMVGGLDATEDFDAVHSDAAKEQLKTYHIAELAPEGVQVPAELLYCKSKAAKVADVEVQACVVVPEEKPFLHPKQAKKAFLVHKEMLSHDVALFRFSLEHEKQLLGLPTGKHMLLRKKHVNKEGQDEVVMRAYTPTTANETFGHFDLVVKIYRAGIHPKFPDGGKFSQVRLTERFKRQDIWNPVQTYQHFLGMARDGA